MFIISTLRRLRHGPLRRFDSSWLWFGKLYQHFVSCLPGLKTKQYINKYGPFKLDAKFTFSNFANWGSGHNEGFVSCIEDCRGSRCVFDIGAHIGLVSLPASQVVAGKIYAFEPAEANLRHLRNHISYNHSDNIEIHTCLVGAETQSNIEFFEQQKATGMNSRVVKKNHHLYHKTLRDQTTLDDFSLSRNLIPDVIKVDVEGAEYDVLMGAQNILLKHNPIIYLSIHPKELSLMGHSVDQVIHFLNELNYYAYDQQGQLIHKFEFSEYRFIKKDS